mmetsp:Transcript_9225/g.23383  ORF Transcript_9225/g.23383 Transcript_9225/m.23383 type:complete len:201 (+) Transcript_9225:174-776(+)
MHSGAAITPSRANALLLQSGQLARHAAEEQARLLGPQCGVGVLDGLRRERAGWLQVEAEQDYCEKSDRLDIGQPVSHALARPCRSEWTPRAAVCSFAVTRGVEHLGVFEDGRIARSDADGVSESRPGGHAVASNDGVGGTRAHHHRHGWVDPESLEEDVFHEYEFGQIFKFERPAFAYSLHLLARACLRFRMVRQKIHRP